MRLEKMAYHLTTPASGKSAMRPENRACGFSRNDCNLPLENRLRCPELRRKSRATPTIFTPGIPHWPSRDPNEENWSTGEFNEYTYIRNEGIGDFDILGRESASQKRDRAAERNTTRINNQVSNQNQKITDNVGGNRPPSLLEPSAPSTNPQSAFGNAVILLFQYGGRVAKDLANDQAFENAVQECKKLLANSPCTGDRCNSCDITYMVRDSPAIPAGGGNGVREFAKATARPCLKCWEPRPPGLWPQGGPGLPPQMKLKHKAIGVLPDYYVNIEEPWWKRVLWSEQFWFTIEYECIQFGQGLGEVK